MGLLGELVLAKWQISAATVSLKRSFQAFSYLGVGGQIQKKAGGTFAKSLNDKEAKVVS